MCMSSWVVLLAHTALFVFLYSRMLMLSGSFHAYGDYCSKPEWEYCGKISNDKNSRCVNPSFEVTCEDNKPVIYFNYGKHETTAAILAVNSTFRYINTSIGVPPSNCSLINFRSSPYENVAFLYDRTRLSVVLLSCGKPVNLDDYWDISCSSAERNGNHYYALSTSYSTLVEDVVESCTVELKVVMGPWRTVNCSRNCSYPDLEIHTLFSFAGVIKYAAITGLHRHQFQYFPADPTSARYTFQLGFSFYDAMDLYKISIWVTVCGCLVDT
ncbi:hypothetical protein RJT34_03503 [Clitoria ternatea]|uniref:Wall-associated receptor kinase galacturonan-binding domain-containing protein n=1 Tax=Clitoria ternatea TaxID=43366 RepID=A0AAN9KKW2_CLITE